jgi:hypothetical protein
MSCVPLEMPGFRAAQGTYLSGLPSHLLSLFSPYSNDPRDVATVLTQHAILDTKDRRVRWPLQFYIAINQKTSTTIWPVVKVVRLSLARLLRLTAPPLSRCCHRRIASAESRPKGPAHLPWIQRRRLSQPAPITAQKMSTKCQL